MTRNSRVFCYRETAAEAGDASSIARLNYQVIDEAEGSIGETMTTSFVAQCFTSIESWWRNWTAIGGRIIGSRVNLEQ